MSGKEVVTAREKKPTRAKLWERAGYLRAASAAAADASASAAAYAAAGASVDADAYDAGMARWAREHPPKEGKPE